MRPCKREAEDLTEKKRADVTTKAEAGVIHYEVGGMGHKPRNAVAIEATKGKEKSLPRTSRKN